MTQCAPEVCLSHHEAIQQNALVIQTLEQVFQDPQDYRELLITPHPNPALKDPRISHLETAEKTFLSLPSRDLASPHVNQSWRNLLKTMQSIDPTLEKSMDSIFAKAKHDAEPNKRRIIPSDLVQQKLGTTPIFSASQFRSYAECPFAYFMDYLLRLKERDVWTPKVTHLGTFMHGLLEQTYAVLIRMLNTDIRPQEILALWYQKDPEELMAQAYAQLLEQNPEMRRFAEPEYKNSITRFATRRSLQLLEDKHFLHDDFIPQKVEWGFGPPNDFTPSVQGDIPYGIRGKIDRIDCSIDNPNILAIRDYKSSETKFVPWKFLAGLDIQLPLYVLALHNWLETKREAKHIESAGWIDLGLKPTELSSDEPQPTDDTWPVIRIKTAKKKLSTIEDSVEEIQWPKVVQLTKSIANYWVEQITQGKVIASPVLANNYNAHCEYCDHRAACGYTDPTLVARDYRDGKNRAKEEIEKILK